MVLLGILVVASVALVVGATMVDNWLRSLPGGDECYGRPVLFVTYDAQPSLTEIDEALNETGWKSRSLLVEEQGDNQTIRRLAASVVVSHEENTTRFQFIYERGDVEPRVPEESEEYLGPLVAPTLEHFESLWGPPIVKKYAKC